jgi:hypothetical protein
LPFGLGFASVAPEADPFDLSLGAEADPFGLVFGAVGVVEAAGFPDPGLGEVVSPAGGKLKAFGVLQV